MTPPPQYQGIYALHLFQPRIDDYGNNVPIQVVHHGDAQFILEPLEEIGITLAISTACEFRWRHDGKTENLVPQIGQMTIMSPGSPFNIDIRGSCTTLLISLPIQNLYDWWLEDHGIVETDLGRLTQFVFEDPFLAHLLCCARFSEVEAGDELLRTFATYLLQKTFTKRLKTGSHILGGLTTKQIRRVTHRIESDIDGNLSLDILADEARMSPFHFLREFKKTMGQSPHQYVIDRRLSRATELLRSSHNSIQEVATAVGFFHASHLSRYTKRIFGCSPTELRQLILM